MSLLRNLLIALATPVILYLGAAAIWGRDGVWEGLFGKIEREPVDFATLELPMTPNQFLMCPPDFCRSQAHAESPVFNLAAIELRDRWRSFLAGQENVVELTADDARMQYEYEARSPLLRFPDTVTARVVALGDDQATLAIYSRSHYGKTDFGANRKRIKAWLLELTSEPGAP